MKTNPNFPLYIVSKGRWESRLTRRALESMGVGYYIVVEAQERAHYVEVVADVLVLDKQYQDDYDTFDNLGDTKSRGPGPARNFAWEHSAKSGFDWHWVMDDNIRDFYRLNNNLKARMRTGSIFRCMEDFVLRYSNVAMAGPNYEMLVPRKAKVPPFIANTRIYSCNLIRNDVPYRWRGRYNEDTDLSLRMLKDGWCTIQFNAFLQDKVANRTLQGGNTEEFYNKEGTLPKSKMQVKMHPEVSKLVWKFNRWHHTVDYKPFKKNKLVKRDEVHTVPEPNEYGMRLVKNV